MVEASAKELRPIVTRALRAGLGERGWSPKRGRATVLVSGPEVAEPPIEFELAPALEGDKYGGVRFELSVALHDREGEAEVASFPRAALPDFRFVDEIPLAPRMSIGGTEAGILTSANRSVRYWRIRDTDDIDAEVADWFGVLDGPVTEWVGRRRSRADLIGLFRNEPQQLSVQPSGARVVPVVALREGAADVARAVVAAYERGLDDTRERYAAFERELAARYPQYGALQRS